MLSTRDEICVLLKLFVILFLYFVPGCKTTMLALNFSLENPA